MAFLRRGDSRSVPESASDATVEARNEEKLELQSVLILPVGRDRHKPYVEFHSRLVTLSAKRNEKRARRPAEDDVVSVLFFRRSTIIAEFSSHQNI